MENKKLYILQYNYTGETYVFSTAKAAQDYAIHLIKNDPNYEEDQTMFDENIDIINKHAIKYGGEFDSDVATCYAAPFIE